MKKQFEESTFTIEEIKIGMDLVEIEGKGRAKVIDKTNSSINVKMFKTGKNGIDCTGWYELSWFNRTYKQA